MKVEVSQQDKLATVWLAQSERDNPSVRTQLEALCEDCKSKKYTVAIFQSGTRNLLSQTSGLLCYNRRRSAEITGRGM